MGCKDCSSGTPFSLRVDHVRRLYNPTYSAARTGGKPVGCGKMKCGKSKKCQSACSSTVPSGDRYKSYWTKKNECGLRKYEDQPWFRNPVIQEEWDEFVGKLVTPQNIEFQLQPGPDDYEYNCNKVRALMAPQTYCVWDLPDQDDCATTRYGYNRDWRRYNEDQRVARSDILCGCSNEPICKPTEKTCEVPPYLGKKYGPRYMGWAHPHSFMFPRPRVFNYQSLPKC